MKKLFILVITLLAINLVACANMSETQQRTATGALGGAAIGAGIGALAGNAGMGAAIGGAAGGTGGFLLGRHKEAERRAYNRGRQSGQSGW
jgi:uncharacterized membrane protein